jgi:uncharacterized membrane protein
MDAKTKAIISHITFVGWVIALVINSGKKDEYASFYIRQNLGLMLAGIALGIIWVIPILGWLIGTVGYILLFVFWLMSLIWSINDEMKPVPVVGKSFQEWFKTL